MSFAAAKIKRCIDAERPRVFARVYVRARARLRDDNNFLEHPPSALISIVALARFFPPLNQRLASGLYRDGNTTPSCVRPSSWQIFTRYDIITRIAYLFKYVFPRREENCVT